MSQATIWASARTRARSAGDAGKRGGMGLVQVLQDRQGLGERRSPVGQHRNQGLRIQGLEWGCKLPSPFPGQMNEFSIVGDILEVERDADAKACRGAEISVKLHPT